MDRAAPARVDAPGFYLDETGVIRQRDGGTAGPSDPEVTFDCPADNECVGDILKVAEGEGEGEGEGEPPHTASYHDTDANQNYRIELPELLRLVQFYNAGAYHCAPGTV